MMGSLMMMHRFKKFPLRKWNRLYYFVLAPASNNEV